MRHEPGGQAFFWYWPPILLLTAACETTVPPVDVDVHRVAVADVVSVEASRESGSYVFAVGVSSPDTGCEQYADWWEVMGADGELLYRRVLTHSHVDEQPFTRSGGPVVIREDREVWVRAHMHPGGYGGIAWKGSVASGFAPATLAADFAAALAVSEPLPDACRF